MVFMIINLIRSNPQLFLQALSILQDRCSQRQTPHNLSFRVEDVGYAIEMLTSMAPRDPLFLAEDLCEYSRNLLQSQPSASKDDETEKDALMREKGPSALEKRKKA